MADGGVVQDEFLQEVQVLGACRHHNLLPLIGVAANGGKKGSVCLVFPLLQGGSLHDRVLAAPGRERLGWMDRVRAMLSVAQVLHYLHTADPAVHKPVILHRDIKPPNILLDADGHVRLADVGVAKMQEPDSTHVTLHTAVAGTPGFVDPDYMTTGHYDAACDAYSLGVTATRWKGGSRCWIAVGTPLTTVWMPLTLRTRTPAGLRKQQRRCSAWGWR